MRLLSCVILLLSLNLQAETVQQIQIRKFEVADVEIKGKIAAASERLAAPQAPTLDALKDISELDVRNMVRCQANFPGTLYAIQRYSEELNGQTDNFPSIRSKVKGAARKAFMADVEFVKAYGTELLLQNPDISVRTLYRDCLISVAVVESKQEKTGPAANFAVLRILAQMGMTQELAGYEEVIAVEVEEEKSDSTSSTSDTSIGEPVEIDLDLDGAY